MNHDTRLFAAVLALVALASCNSTKGGAPEACRAYLSKEDRAAISANSQAWLKAVRAHDWAAATATYTTDAMLLPPNEPAVSGREAIHNWFLAFPPLVSMDLIEAEIDGCCDVAYVRGTYRLSIAPPGAGTITDTGKYVEIRHKQADGTWLKLRDMFSSDMPAAH